MYSHTDTSETLLFNFFSKVKTSDSTASFFPPFGERQLNFGCNLILPSGSSQCRINVVMIKESV